LNIMGGQNGAYHVGFTPNEGGQWWFDFVWRDIWCKETFLLPIKNKANKVPDHPYTGAVRKQSGNAGKSESSAPPPQESKKEPPPTAKTPSVKEPSAEHSICSDRTAEMTEDDCGSFLITSKASSSEVIKGDHKYDIKINGPSKVVSKITNNGDGTYNCSFGPAKKGEYNVEVTYKGKVINKGSWTVKVSEATADVAFEDVTILFQATDKYGTPKSSGGEMKKFKVITTGEEVELIDLEDGRYTLEYHVVPGRNSIDVQYEGASIGGFPISFDVEE